MKKILLLALLLGCAKMYAVTRTAVVNNGAWSAPATWSGNAVPGAADTAIIPVGIRVLANLGTTFMAPWNNAKTIFVRGTLEVTGNDPVFSNPTTIEVYNGGTFYDHTDFAEFYMNPVSRIIIRLGASCLSGFYPSTNILNSSGGSPSSFTIPVPVTPPFTITINNGSIGYTASVPLPLELTRFDVVQQGRQVQLHWQTAGEKQTAYFEAEHSAGGKVFASIGRVKAAGAGAHAYQITDAMPETGNNLYRLKMIDADGSYTYSNVVSLNFNAATSNTVLYPNPAYDKLYISNAATQAVSVFNVLGQLVLKQEITKGDAVLDISALKDGVYYLSMDGQQMKFVKGR